jgi:AraC-like DNA-binding protein
MRAFSPATLRPRRSKPLFIHSQLYFVPNASLCIPENAPHLFLSYFDERSMIRYSYQLTDFRHWLSNFGNLLHLPVIGGRLKFPPDLGAGFIHAVHVSDGYSFVVMDFMLNDDLVFFRQASTPKGLSLFFGPSPHLSSTASEEELSFARETRVKCIGLFFPETFLRRHIRKDIFASLLDYAENPPANTSREPIAFEYRSVLEDIHGADADSPLLHLQLHNRIQLLTERYLHSFLTKANFPLPDGKTWVREKEKDLEALKGIVQILSDSALSKFPSIDTLSHTAKMSSTKLKTRFKQIYGMKLYEFYNRNRLEQAREMLKSGNYSVKQVGINIGFSNLSNFAKAFRKEFGILPKEILKNR